MIATFFMPMTTQKRKRVPGTRPHRYDFSWEGFVNYLRESASVPTPKSHKEVPTVEVIALGMAIYDDGDAKRGKDYAEGADWIGLDIDDKPKKDEPEGAVLPKWKFDDLVEFLDDAGVAYAIYTTTSCTEERHCLRVILPFSRRVHDLEWPAVWTAFAAWIGQIDRQTSDISRLLFEPRAWEGAYNRFHASATDLSFVDVDNIVERFSPPAAPPVIDRQDHAPVEAHRVRSEFTGDLTDFDTSPIIRPEWVDDARTAQQGGRMYRFLCRVALSARTQSIQLSEFELVDIGRQLAHAIGRRDHSDIRRDAARALAWSETVSLDIGQSSAPRLPPAWPWSIE